MQPPIAEQIVDIVLEELPHLEDHRGDPGPDLRKRLIERLEPRLEMWFLVRLDAWCEQQTQKLKREHGCSS